MLFDIKNSRTIKAEYFDLSNFTLLDWGKWTTKNYYDLDYNLDTEVSYTYSDLQDVKFDKAEIINEISNIDLRSKIESLERKVSINLDEKLYTELLSLRNQLKGG